MCALLGLGCIIYMGAKDMERQSLNVFRMRLMGAEVRPVYSGTATLKDATSEAIRDWVRFLWAVHSSSPCTAGGLHIVKLRGCQVSLHCGVLHVVCAACWTTSPLHMYMVIWRS